MLKIGLRVIFKLKNLSELQQGMVDDGTEVEISTPVNEFIMESALLRFTNNFLILKLLNTHRVSSLFSCVAWPLEKIATVLFTTLPPTLTLILRGNYTDTGR